MTADIIIVVVLSLLSILMILMEIFLLPGITVAGIAGAVFSMGSIWYAYSHLGAAGGHVTVALSVVLFGFLFVWLIRSRAIDRISLQADIDAKVDTGGLNTVTAGDEGLTVSRLNPVGKARINGVFVEAKAETGFLDEGVRIVVLKKLASQVIVREKAEE
jgi:membrane-bound ClpP family serine protease